MIIKVSEYYYVASLVSVYLGITETHGHLLSTMHWVLRLEICGYEQWTRGPKVQPQICWYPIAPPSTSDFSGKLGLNFALGLVTSSCGCMIACCRPVCCWLRWGSMSIGDPSKGHQGWRGDFFRKVGRRDWSWTWTRVLEIWKSKILPKSWLPTEES